MTDSLEPKDGSSHEVGKGEVGSEPNGPQLSGSEATGEPMHLEPISRGAFLKTCFGGFACAWGAMTLYPVCRYLYPAETEDTESTVESVTIGKVEDLPKGTGKNFKFGHKPALITHTDDGQLHAFIAICTHLGCTVQFNNSKDLIWCACHGGVYDPSSGKNVSGPPPKPLAPLKVEVLNGDIVVSRADA